MLGRPISCRVNTATADWGLPSLMRADCRKPGSNERRVSLWASDGPTSHRLTSGGELEGTGGLESRTLGDSCTVEDAQVAAPEDSRAHAGLVMCDV